jgi:hypothetical protein
MREGKGLVLLALAVMVPACGNGNGGRESTQRFVLFTEDFAETSLPPDWTVSGSGTVVIDTAQGTPAPSLSLFPPNGPALSSLRVTTAPDFTTATPLSVQVDLLFADPSVIGTGTAAVTLLDPTAPGVGASAVYNAQLGRIRFAIGGVLGPEIDDPGGWRRVTFRVDANGTATWTLDGAVLQVVPNFPLAELALRVQNDSDAVFNFDSVVVTSP